MQRKYYGCTVHKDLVVELLEQATGEKFKQLMILFLCQRIMNVSNYTVLENIKKSKK